MIDFTKFIKDRWNFKLYFQGTLLSSRTHFAKILGINTLLRLEFESSLKIESTNSFSNTVKGLLLQPLILNYAQILVLVNIPLYPLLISPTLPRN